MRCYLFFYQNITGVSFYNFFFFWSKLLQVKQKYFFIILLCVVWWRWEEGTLGSWREAWCRIYHIVVSVANQQIFVILLDMYILPSCILQDKWKWITRKSMSITRTNRIILLEQIVMYDQAHSALLSKWGLMSYMLWVNTEYGARPLLHLLTCHSVSDFIFVCYFTTYFCISLWLIIC